MKSFNRIKAPFRLEIRFSDGNVIEQFFMVGSPDRAIAHVLDIEAPGIVSVGAEVLTTIIEAVQA